MDDEEHVDLLLLWSIARRYKYIIAAITFVFVGAAAALALTETPIFRAQAVVTEVQVQPMSGAAAIGAEFGGLASLAGISIGGGGGLGRQAEATLQSHYLVREFIERNGLLPVLFPHAKRPPTMWMAVRDFHDGVLSVTDDNLTGTTTVSVDWRDPVVASQWANGIVALANSLLRMRAMNDAQRNITFLSDQLASTRDLDLRKVLYDLIEDQTKTLMLAKGREEYAFAMVDPAVPPDIRIKPKRTLMVLAGGMLGVFLGFMVAFVSDKVRRQRAAGVSS